jgi:hypothetical protein
MENNGIGWRKPLALVGQAVLLGTGPAVGLWLWQTQEINVPVLLALTLLAGTAVFGVVWLSLTRAARRLQAAVDIYAEREIARARRFPAPQ